MSSKQKIIKMRANASLLKGMKYSSYPVIIADGLTISVEADICHHDFQSFEKLSTKSLETFFIIEVMIGGGSDNGSRTMYAIQARFQGYRFVPIALLPDENSAYYYRDELRKFYLVDNNIGKIDSDNAFRKTPRRVKPKFGFHQPKCITVRSFKTQTSIITKETHLEIILLIALAVGMLGVAYLDFTQNFGEHYTAKVISILSLVPLLLSLLIFSIHNITTVYKDRIVNRVKFAGLFDSTLILKWLPKSLRKYINLGYSHIKFSDITKIDIYYYARVPNFKRYITFDKPFFYTVVVKHTTGRVLFLSKPFKDRDAAIYMINKVNDTIAKHKEK